MEGRFARGNSDYINVPLAGLRRLTIQRRLVMRRCLFSFVAALALALPALAQAQPTIYGTMSNFDVFNQTTTNAYGAELELEGVHSSEVTNTYPSHYSSKNQVDYSNGVVYGTRITFNGYNFNPSGYLAPSVGQSTNGHFCVNVPGCEHFGFAVNVQPTATRYFWTDQNGQRIGVNPLTVPTPTWSVQPQGGGGLPVVVAQVQVPEPAEVHPLLPDSVWMKVYKTELNRPVDLAELISNGDVVPEDVAEIESEWELLEGGKALDHQDELPDGKESVIRRYEFYKYTGLYNAEHEPLSAFAGGDPPPGELGPFIAANMAAINFAEAPVPEPAMMYLLLLMTAGIVRRRR
jgi:hypothetical protein